MSRLNIQHPITKQWRCFSTEIDSWVSEWLPEDQYKEWLIQEAAKQTAYYLDQCGVRTSQFCNYNDAIYNAVRKQYKDNHCETCTESDCDNCKVWAYADWVDYLHNASEDFFRCKQDLIEETSFTQSGTDEVDRYDTYLHSNN